MFGEDCVDTAAEEVAGDGVTNFACDDDADFVLSEFRDDEATENKVGTSLGFALLACAGEFRVARHAELSFKAHGEDLSSGRRNGHRGVAV